MCCVSLQIVNTSRTGVILLMSTQTPIADVCLWEELRQVVFCPNWRNASWALPVPLDTDAPTYEPTQGPHAAAPVAPHVVVSVEPTRHPTLRETTSFPSASPTSEPTATLWSPSPVVDGLDGLKVNASSECRNMFGGGDVNGVDCEVIAVFTWLFVAACAVCLAWCACWWCGSARSGSGRNFLRYGRLKVMARGAEDDEDSGYDAYDDDDVNVLAPGPRGRMGFINPSGSHRVASSGSAPPRMGAKHHSITVASSSLSSSMVSTRSDSDDPLELEPTALGVSSPEHAAISSFNNAGAGPAQTGSRRRSTATATSPTSVDRRSLCMCRC